MTRNPFPSILVHQPSTPSAWQPNTPWQTRTGRPVPRSAYSTVPKRVSSFPVGMAAIRLQARCMSCRYLLATSLTSRCLRGCVSPGWRNPSTEAAEGLQRPADALGEDLEVRGRPPGRPPR